MHILFLIVAFFEIPDGCMILRGYGLWYEEFYTMDTIWDDTIYTDTISDKGYRTTAYSYNIKGVRLITGSYINYNAIDKDTLYFTFEDILREIAGNSVEYIGFYIMYTKRWYVNPDVFIYYKREE